MTDQLSDLLNQHLSSTGRPAARPDDEGTFTIEPADGVVVGAVMLSDGRLELFSNPGHVNARTLKDLIENDQYDDEDDDLDGNASGAVPGAVVRWHEGKDHWGLHVDRQSGLVTLTQIAAQLPWHSDGLGQLLEAFCQEHARWVARLEREPPAAEELQTSSSELGSLAFARA
jgi:hypothetical protein